MVIVLAHIRSLVEVRRPDRVSKRFRMPLHTHSPISFDELMLRLLAINTKQSSSQAQTVTKQMQHQQASTQMVRGPRVQGSKGPRVRVQGSKGPRVRGSGWDYLRHQRQLVVVVVLPSSLLPLPLSHSTNPSKKMLSLPRSASSSSQSDAAATNTEPATIKVFVRVATAFHVHAVELLPSHEHDLEPPAPVPLTRSVPSIDSNHNARAWIAWRTRFSTPHAKRLGDTLRYRYRFDGSLLSVGRSRHRDISMCSSV